MRRSAGEDSWILGLDFVTSYFHSLAPEERLSSSISKEQLVLPPVSSDVSLCAVESGELSHMCGTGQLCQIGQGVGKCESDACQVYMLD